MEKVYRIVSSPLITIVFGEFLAFVLFLRNPEDYTRVELHMLGLTIAIVFLLYRILVELMVLNEKAK